jgi:hypothetical protein
MEDNNQQRHITIDPIRYLEKLPEFNGHPKDLSTFTNLIDRVHPYLQTFDDLSQLLFSDLIKSRLTGRAREIIEINCQATSWLEIKTILQNNFGEKKSTDELYDELRATTFKTNSVEFFNEIKQKLRNLNNKTVIMLGPGAAANECARNNMRTALNIFKSKIPEPMKTILACRNPDSLESAMEILFNSGYAHINGENNSLGQFNPRNRNRSQTQRQPQTNYNNRPNSYNNNYRQNNQLNQNQRSPNFRRQNNRFQPNNNDFRNNNNFHNQERNNQYNGPNDNFNNNFNNNQFRNNQNNNPGFNNFRNFNANPPFQQPNRLPPPEPMEINTNEAQVENFHVPASTGTYPT